MQLSRVVHASVWLPLLTLTSILAQTIVPSNSSTDLAPAASSPRFLLNGTELPHLPTIPLAPLVQYVNIAHHDFLTVSISGKLFNVDNTNANQVQSNTFAYISCDPQAYPGYLNVVDVFNTVVWSTNADIIILYSEFSDHCNLTLPSNTPQINGILTTTDPVTATALAAMNLTSSSPGFANVLPDLNSYTNTSASSGFDPNQGVLGPSPTTAVAMIILYSITGIITALFIIIIFVGAIRAHRHPERYGPRNVAGRPRQSRAKGIARAMLETLPIVKFGDHVEEPVKVPATGAATGDIEMTAGTAHTDAATPDTTTGVEGTESERKGSDAGHHHADGTTDDGTLGCSICTEDFTKGEEVRVLPCNHKFHPDCVDPWLLNVSGTCPLCRIDLQPKKKGEADAAPITDTNLPPPLTVDGDVAGPSQRRDTGLAVAATGTVEERIAALRRHRLARRSSGARTSTDAERRGLSARLRQKFRIRTVAQGVERSDTLQPVQNSGNTTEHPQNVDLRTEEERQQDTIRHRDEARQGHWGARAYLASFWRTGNTGVSLRPGQNGTQ